MNEEDGENTVSQTNTSEDQEHITTHSSLEGRIDETNDKVEELEEKKKVGMVSIKIQDIGKSYWMENFLTQLATRAADEAAPTA